MYQGLSIEAFILEFLEFLSLPLGLGFIISISIKVASKLNKTFAHSLYLHEGICMLHIKEFEISSFLFSEYLPAEHL